jgi:hypothetical protein
MACTHGHGLAVFLYRPTETMTELIDIGVDAVHVDRPDRLSALLRDHPPKGR